MANIKTKIGLQVIAAMPPGPFLIWDSAVKGFCCRRQFSDTITYSVVFRTRMGLQRWMKVGRHGIITPTEARTEAVRILRAVTLGEDPANERYALRSGATMAELLDDFVTDMDARRGPNGKKNTTIKSDKSRIAAHIKPKLGRYRVTAITQPQVEEFINSCSTGSAGRILALLSGVFSFSIKRKLRPDNPCKGVTKPKDNRKTRRLSIAEYQQFGAALASSASVPHDIFLFLAVTGFRSNEARCLKWSELDIDRRIINLQDSKTGKSTRPLSGVAIDIIKRQERNGDYVFNRDGNTLSNLEPSWHKLKLPRDITKHTLRHSLASLAADMGYSDNTIASLLGHSRGSVTSRYLHGSDKALIAAADGVAAETMRLMQKNLGPLQSKD